MRPRWDASPETSGSPVQVCEERTRDPEGDGGCEVRPEVRRWKVVGEGKRG